MGLVVLGALFGGCTPPAPDPPPAPTGQPATLPPIPAPGPPKPVLPAPPPNNPFPVPPGEPSHKRVLSKRFQLSIPLPDRPGWRLVKDKSSFLVMQHAVTQSELLARVWLERENMTREGCEEQSRLLRELPGRGRVIHEEVIEVPEGFDTAVHVGSSEDNQPGGPVAGQVLAFGASARWCFAFVYQTSATGPGAEGVVGDRLAVIQGLTLAGIERRLMTKPQLR